MKKTDRLPSQIRANNTAQRERMRRRRMRMRSETPSEAWPPPRPRFYKRDCLQGENAIRPCPYLGCRHHADAQDALAAAKNSRNDKAFDVRADALVNRLDNVRRPSCSLDAINAEQTLEWVGAQLGVTSERARQIEAKALRRARKAAVRTKVPVDSDT